jgi:hypothetical protein
MTGPDEPETCEVLRIIAAIEERQEDWLQE